MHVITSPNETQFILYIIQYARVTSWWTLCLPFSSLSLLHSCTPTPFSVSPSHALSCLTDTNTSVSILMSCLTDSNPFSVSPSQASSCLTIRHQPPSLSLLLMLCLAIRHQPPSLSLLLMLCLAIRHQPLLCRPFSCLVLSHNQTPTPSLSLLLMPHLVSQSTPTPSLSLLLMPCLVSQSDTNPFSVAPSHALSCLTIRHQPPSISASLLMPSLLSLCHAPPNSVCPSHPSFLPSSLTHTHVCTHTAWKWRA